MPIAKIKLVQGVTTPPAGEALVGVAATTVNCTNSDNTGVERFEWEMLDVPNTSTVPTGVLQAGKVPQLDFLPDIAGSYHVELRTYDATGRMARDRTTFIVPESNNLYIPPWLGDDQSLNYGGQTKGWKTLMTAWLKAIVAGGGGGFTPTGTGIPHVVAGVYSAAASLIVNADVSAGAAIAGSKLQAAAAANLGAIQLAGDLAGIGGTGAAPKVSGMTGDGSGKVTHAETFHEFLNANQRLRDERFEFPLTGSVDTLWSLVIPSGETWVVDFELVAHVVGGGNSNVYRATRKVKNVAGTVTQSTIGTDVASEDLAGTVDYTNNTTTIRLRYTKPTGTWRAVGRVTINGAVA